MEDHNHKNEQSDSDDEAPSNRKKSEISSVDVTTLKRDYNIASEVGQMVAMAGKNKSSMSPDKTIFLGFLAGIFVSYAAILSLCAGGGFSETLRREQPIIPKLAFSMCFPFGLFLIILFGGDLFTGNTMIMTVSYFHGRISGKDLLKNWLLVFFSNFAGCLFGAYFFGYLTEIFVDPTLASYVRGIAEKKARLTFWVIFLRGIPANSLVCLSIFMGLAARDVVGKIIGMWFPIFAFAVSGFEHCVANMFLISIGMMYGADVNYGQFAMNLIPAVLGNIVGGSLLVGLSEVYLYHWKWINQRTAEDNRKIKTGIPGVVLPHVQGTSTVIKQKILSTLNVFRRVKKSAKLSPVSEGAKEHQEIQRSTHTTEPHAEQPDMTIRKPPELH